MPKVIENLRENILRSAKASLLESGYDALNIRAVARECGIAVGTVYNYFPSKDMLAGCVILGDWLAETERMRALCAAAPNLAGALRALYGCLSDFYGIYRAVWEGYTFSESAKGEYAQRHKLLVRQLADCLRPALERHGKIAEGTDIFLAENVLVCAGDSLLSFESFLDIVARIL